jgi:ABC-type transport system involved in multi-copper enzyme maturation permease subunit
LKNIGTLSLNVIKDTARRKLFYVVFFFGLAVVALSPLLPTFELGMRSQFLKDISLSLASLFGVVLAVVLSVNQVPGELNSRTIYNILSKPVSRPQYLLGKYLGVLADLAIILFVMGLEILVLISARAHAFSPVIFQGVFAVFLECAIIAAFCLFLSTFATVPVNVFATILFYLLCHVKTDFLHNTLVKGTSGLAKVLAWPAYYLLPNLENYNISQQVGYGKGVPAGYLLRVSGYALLFVVLFLFLGYMVFRRKDL